MFDPQGPYRASEQYMVIGNHLHMESLCHSSMILRLPKKWSLLGVPFSLACIYLGSKDRYRLCKSQECCPLVLNRRVHQVVAPFQSQILQQRPHRDLQRMFPESDPMH